MWTFVRHGETDWNAAGQLQGRTDVPLNARGREQAARVGRRLARAAEPYTAVWASPLARTRETAEIIARELGVGPVRTHPGLTERGFGAAEGARFGSARHRDRDRHAEPAADVIARGTAALSELHGMHSGERIVIVSHGAFIRLLLDHLTRDAHTRIANAEVRDFAYTPPHRGSTAAPSA